MEGLKLGVSQKRIDPVRSGFCADWSREFKAMDEHKEGARYRYPDSFIKLLAVVHAYVPPYRQPEGFTRALSQHVDGSKAPEYTTI